MLSLRESIASILDVSDTPAWQIMDTRLEEGLYLVHYSQDANMVKYGSLRGVVVDIPHQAIVARSYGFTPTLSASSMSVADYDQKIHLTDATNPNVTYDLDPETTLFYPGFDGPLVRVFLHNGQVYHSTHKKLQTLMDVWEQLGGPRDDELFDMGKKYSPYVHIFILASPELQMVSKTPVGAGYLIYLGTRKMWEQSPYSESEVDWEQRKNFTTVESFQSYPETPLILDVRAFDLEEANKYLTYGQYESFDLSGLEERLWPGEFILAYLHSPSGESTGVLKIESPSYHWRATMRDNNLDLTLQFYLLSNGKFIRAEFEEERELYLRKFPLLTPYDISAIEGLIQQDGPLVVWPQEEIPLATIEVLLADPTSRLYNIFLAFFYSLPPSQQEKALRLLQSYEADIKALTEVLIQVQDQDELRYVPARARYLINTARSFGQDLLLGNNPERHDLNALIDQEITSLVKLEEGYSLYRLVQSLVGHI
jgi:hypothetical protein